MKRYLTMLTLLFLVSCATISKPIIQKQEINRIIVSREVEISFHDVLHSWNFPFPEIWGRHYEVKEYRFVEISRRSPHMEYTILHELLHAKGYGHTKEFFDILKYRYGFNKKGEKIKNATH